MKYIIGKNDSDKTKQLIRQSIDTGIPIFALYEGKAESLRAKALTYFGEKLFVVTPKDFTSGIYSGKILVDDLEKAFTQLLASYLDTPDFDIITATLTED